jgi:hypothetical protein
MHNNICSKCGQEFETKNPKRIVCPNCLYLDKGPEGETSPATNPYPQQRPNYGDRPQYDGPPRQGPPREGGYGRPNYDDRPQYDGPPRQGPPRDGGYGRPNYGDRPQYGGPPRQGPPRDGGYGRPNYGDRPQYGGPPRQGPPQYGPPRQGPPRGPGGFRPGGPPRGPGGFRPGGPPRGPRPPKRELLIPKEALIEIEKLYKAMLPLPNPDAHEKIGEALSLDPKKAFFGINLVRAKMMLPKAEFPKRPLAVTEDQLTAVRSLYEPFLPVPPIGIHKIIARQLRMDEWRAHVAIGIIRKQLNMARWNEDRPDIPEAMKIEIEAARARVMAELAEQEKNQAAGETASSEAENTTVEKPEPKKRARKAKVTEPIEDTPSSD